MKEIKKPGFCFSMDDFGTGYSSLRYLKRLPVNEIKIDRSFIFGVDNAANDQVMVISILNIAGQFNLMIVAEGNEARWSLIFYNKINVIIIRKGYFSKLLTDDEVNVFL